MKTALVAGATGLVGGELVKQLSDDIYYDEIKLISRKPLTFGDKRIKIVLVSDFDKLGQQGAVLSADDVYCCLGTTIKKAGNKENFKKVDYQYPLNLANISLKHGAGQFLLVSSMGADPKSFFFYNRIKGELEQELGTLPFRSILVFRPSLLLGDRSEHRAGEKFAQWILPLFSPLMRGPLEKYRAIRAADVAAAMLSAGKRGLRGVHIFNSEEVKKWSGLADGELRN
jgi:uncharacterized protein YbjT (DUF2867 family)